MLKLRLGLYLALFLGLVAGCASERNPQAPARVSGLVRYQGSPLQGGSITFHSEGKGTYTCSLGPDGTYEVFDIPTGSMVITVETESANPQRKREKQAYGGDKGAKLANERAAAEKRTAPAQQVAPRSYRRIPEKYASSKTSPLTLEVVAGRQVKEFELTE